MSCCNDHARCLVGKWIRHATPLQQKAAVEKFWLQKKSCNANSILTLHWLGYIVIVIWTGYNWRRPVIQCVMSLKWPVIWYPRVSPSSCTTCVLQHYDPMVYHYKFLGQDKGPFFQTGCVFVDNSSRTTIHQFTIITHESQSSHKSQLSWKSGMDLPWNIAVKEMWGINWRGIFLFFVWGRLIHDDQWICRVKTRQEWTMPFTSKFCLKFE